MYLGDYLGDVGPAWTAWDAQVRAQGGVGTTWPFADQYQGLSAARYPAQLYATLYNAGKIDSTAPQQASGSNADVYVLAPAEVQEASPATASLWQQFVNGGFTVAEATAPQVAGGFGTAISDVLSIPRRVLSTALGIPSWAATAVLVGGVAIVGTVLVRSYLPRRNPRGRRRRRR